MKAATNHTTPYDSAYDQFDRLTLINRLRGTTVEYDAGYIDATREEVCIQAAKMPDWPVTDVTVSVEDDDGTTVVAGRMIHATTSYKAGHGKYAELEIDTDR